MAHTRDSLTRFCGGSCRGDYSSVDQRLFMRNFDNEGYSGARSKYVVLSLGISIFIERLGDGSRLCMRGFERDLIGREGTGMHMQLLLRQTKV